MDKKNIERDILKNIEFMIKCNNDRLQCIENKQSNESAEEMKLLHTNLSILTRLKQNFHAQSNSLQQSKSDPQPSTSSSTNMVDNPIKRELSSKSSNKGAKKSRTDSIPERDADGFPNCKYCSYRTASIKYFRFHLQGHRGKKVYSCSKCSAIFKTKNGLKNHLIGNHLRLLKMK
uniref:Probable transcription factor Ken n=1 Tax=Dermatophagoides pteronyssinus TaxID=6956 RepID=A0A6P6YF16_DERPT|nr:probable transcription factor Ken [Dermatophagoides pteronyssinus]